MKYRKAICAIIKHKNQFLAVHKKNDESNIWYVVSGGVEKNETLEIALFRELHEELGLKKEAYEIESKSKISHKFEWDEKTTIRTGFIGQEQEIYFITLKDKKDINLQISNELDEIRWVGRNELLRIIPYENFVKTLKNII